MKKLEDLKNEKFTEDLTSIKGGHIFWRLTGSYLLTDYDDCGDNDITTWSGDTSKDGHETDSWNYC